TFLVFSDYARNAIRMSALMRLRVVYVMTHDAINLGEDGPTHQPVEHLPALRLIPHLDVWRPCDAVETQAAWNAGVTRRDGPSLLALSRQALPHQPRSDAQLDAIARGAYVLADADAPQLVMIATGAEVALAMAARERLAAEGIAARVVSMPCTGAFDRQDATWRKAVLPPAVPRLAIEAAQPDLWWKTLAGAPRSAVIGIDRFGESAPADALAERFGFTIEAIVAAAKDLVT
ncbi:MAG: transketolase, partial [Rhodocyclaceae bacterium]|nr:transketolase [Rhodocyclaceae bacterium]